VSRAIHPSAVIDVKAELADHVEVGAFATVGPGVKLADGVVLHAHAHVTGYTELGAETVVYPFAAIGEPPQDQKYRGEHVRLLVGVRNQFREHSTAHPGTLKGGGITRVGDDNLFMIGAHVAHDCRVGNGVILANHALLAGHVTIGDHAVIQAGAGIQQFLRVGEAAFIAAYAGLIQDAPPFCFLQGYPARVLKLNRVKLERLGWDAARIAGVERAFRIVFRSGAPPKQAFARVRDELADSPDAVRLVDFCEGAERGFARARS
jgi:UDP-N-acetylglucosamine acyltransferase